MATFGQLTGAFLRASQETTVAFANLNFDFALVKYDAPEEYRGLGEALSKRRKESAEDGPVHVTARKLGALFQSVIPDVPNLIQAYGLRVSEIARLPEVNPAGSARQGIFADHVGADGTTIWAAATSGTETVTMHLLACMLARIWSREQAVSIWSELVEQRKIHLQKVVTESGTGFKVSDLAASRVELTRSQLDEWDGSARAWLQTADAAKKLPQTQFRLLVDNISLPVSTHGTVYDAVIESWKGALQTLESLVNGAPQRIDNGAVLLGLSAWHLYPDILLAGTSQYIQQRDNLINPGGIITLGLRNEDEDGRGVFWSLPLAHARYYGYPVVAKRHAGVGESQVSFEEFMFVALGSVLGGWKSHDVSLVSQLSLIQTLARTVGTRGTEDAGWRPSHANDGGVMRWLRSLESAAGEYARSTDINKRQITRLISFGERRCSKLIARRAPDHPPPVFGLADLNVLLRAFEEDSKGRVDFLVNWATREFNSYTASHAVIRYRSHSYAKFRFTNVGSENPHSGKRQKTMRTQSGPSYKETMSLHWIDESDNGDDDENFSDCRVPEDSGLEADIPPGPGQKPVRHFFLCGHPSLAAIYVPAEAKGGNVVQKNCISVSQLIRCIEEGDIKKPQIATALRLVGRSSVYGKYFDSLNAIEAAERIYSKLPGAKVDLRLTSSTVGESKWWKEFQSPKCRTLPAIFSCIAYFETGIFDADPATIGDQTFAVCHATSIFVASSLLSDPIDTTPDVPVERITGNIGKPGLAFLITPPVPKIRKLDYFTWLVTHKPFDGTAQGNFQGTSFHLSFTGYELPLDLEPRGARDAPAYLLETAISVYDRGEWVADLDILRSSKDWIKGADRSCNHSSEERKDTSPLLPLVSADSWLELLDTPVHNAVVRAHGNPVARLATAALAVRVSRTVIILDAKPCWACQRGEIWTPKKTGFRPIEDDDPDREYSEEDSVSGPSADLDIDSSPRDTYAFDLPVPDVENEDGVKPRLLFIL